jgi:hypothetical protein
MKAGKSRFNVASLGRRFGKTLFGEAEVVDRALEGYPTAWFAPTYKLLAEPWRDLKRILAPVTVAKNELEHRIELATGGVVECWSLDGEDPARGRKYARVVVDEAAMVRDLLGKWQAAVRPTLTDYRGDAWFLSTPKGLNGFHALFQQGQDPAMPEWASFAGPTSGNPYIDPAEIEDARRDLPERVFAQEYLAEFLVDGAGVFRRVLEAATAKPAAPVPGKTYVFGVDWGRSNDFTAIAVLDADTRTQVHLERFNQIDYHVQVGRLQALAERYRPRLIVAEKNSVGEPLTEMLRRLNLPVFAWHNTNASKAAVVEALALALERGVLTLLDDKVQTGELLAYDAERLPSGMLRYSAPEGMHDDCVISLCLAWAAAVTPSGRPTQRAFSVSA